MAEAAGLIVTFRGDAGPMTKSLVDLQGQLKRFQTALSTATDPARIALLNRAIETTQARLKGLQNFRGQGFNSVTQGANKAAAAVLNTGRVIQDLPYAFNNFGSIANNLDPLFESFTRLREQSKLTGKAIGASLLESLKGAAGIGLALSAMTAGVTIWQMFFSKSKEAADEAKTSLDNYKDSIKGAESEYTKAVQSVETMRQHIELAKNGFIDKKKVVDEYNKTIGQTTGQVKSLDEAEQALNRNAEAYIKFTLYKASANIALAKAAQKAFEIAQKENAPKTVTDLTAGEGDEVRKARKIAESDQKVIALTNMARHAFLARDFSSANAYYKERDEKIAEIISRHTNKRLFAEKDSLEQMAREFNAKSAEISKDFNFDFLDGKFGDKVKTKTPPKQRFEFFDKFFDFSSNKLDLSDEQRHDLMEAANNFAKDFREIYEGLNFHPVGGKTPALELAKAFWADYSKGIVKFKPTAFLDIDLKADMPEVKSVTDSADQFLGSVRQEMKKKEEKAFGAVDNTAFLRQVLLTKYQNVFKGFNQALPETVDIDGVEVPTEKVLNLDTLEKAFQTDTKRLDGMVKDLNAQINATFQNIKVEGIASIGEAIGTALSGGNLDGVFKGFYSSLGSALQGVGKEIIKTSIAMQKVMTAITSAFAGNPAAAIPAGIALIALGTALKAKIAQAAPFAQGGLVYGPTYAMVGEGAGTSRNNPELIAPLNKLRDYIGRGNETIIVMGKIDGNDILISNERQSKRNRRGGLW